MYIQGNTEEEIKSSFRKLAKIYHPDIPGTGNEEKFKSIQAEYETALRKLKNPFQIDESFFTELETYLRRRREFLEEECRRAEEQIRRLNADSLKHYTFIVFFITLVIANFSFFIWSIL